MKYLIISSVAISAFSGVLAPAYACDFLPVGSAACAQACKIVYLEGLPQDICEFGSTNPN